MGIINKSLILFAAYDDVFLILCSTIFIIVPGILMFLIVEKVSKKYANLSSSELFEKVCSGKTILSYGIKMMLAGLSLIFVLLLFDICVILFEDSISFIPPKVFTLIKDLFLPGLAYSSVVVFVGLIVFAFGWFKKGMVARALNMYTERELTEEEKLFVKEQQSIEAWAQQVRAAQVVGSVLGDDVVGNAIKVKSAVGSISLIKSITIKTSRLYIVWILLGLVLTDIIYIFIK